jgi:hypothetical protein
MHLGLKARYVHFKARHYSHVSVSELGPLGPAERAHDKHRTWTYVNPTEGLDAADRSKIKIFCTGPRSAGHTPRDVCLLPYAYTRDGVIPWSTYTACCQGGTQNITRVNSQEGRMTATQYGRTPALSYSEVRRISN